MPFVRASEMVVYHTLVDALLAALSARPAAALLDTPTAHLFTSDTDVGPNTVVGDFTEATFNGYAAAAVGAFAGPVTLSDSDRAIHKEVDWIAGGAIVAPGEVVNGYYVTDTGGTALYWAERFAEPIAIVHPGDFISLDLVFPEPDNRTVP